MRWRKKDVGDLGERLAARHLKRLGLRIVARQYRTRRGEIDLIARDGSQIVFVEVKSRRANQPGHPTDAITPAKQKKLTELALAYLKQHRLLEHRARFDVVAVTIANPVEQSRIEHFPDAFPPVGSGEMFY